MQILIILLLNILLTSYCYATLTPGKIPVAFKGNQSSNIQDGSMTDTGTPGNIGNVGVGSSNPVQKLDVNGIIRMTGFSMPNNAVSGYVLTSDSNGNGTWVVSSGGGGAGNIGIGTIGHDTVYIGTTSVGSGIIVENSTNVGIGSPLPNATLDVQGTLSLTHFGGNVAIGTFLANRILTVASSNINTNVTTASSSSIGIDNLSGTVGDFDDLAFDTVDTNGSIVLGAKVSGLFTSNTALAVSGDLVFLNKNSGLTQQNMIIKSNGNVGIGTTLPAFPLEVKSGVIGAQGIQTSNSTARINASTGFNVNPNHGSIDTFRVDTGGNVGIGSLSPGQALDVQGTVRMTGFSLPTNASSGYVLTSNNVGIGTWVVASSGGGGSSTTGSNLLFGNGSGGFTNVNNTSTNGTNVGIGSLNPGQILDVQGTIRSQAIQVGANVFTVDNTGTVNTSGSVTSGGNLLINTSGLFVGGSSGGTGNFTNFIGGEGTTTKGILLSTNQNGTTDADELAIGNNGGTIALIAQDASGVPLIGIGTLSPGGALDVESTLNNTIFNALASTKNVGIGTFNPGAKLDVQGPVRILNTPSLSIGTTTLTNYFQVGSTAQLSISSVGALTTTGAVTTGAITGSGNIVSTGVGGIFGGNSATANSHAQFQGGSSATSFIEILGSSVAGNAGYVGIGTIAPQITLDVEGTLLPIVFNGKASTGANVGIGSFNPGQTLDVQGSIRNFGAYIENGNLPSISSCGTSPSGSAVGGAYHFTVTVGGTATACTATYAKACPTGSTCNVTNQSMSITSAMSYTESSSAITISQAVGLSGDVLDINCTCH